MLIEIGIMTSLKSGQAVYEALKDDDKVAYVFLRNGPKRQSFRRQAIQEFGEAAILCIIVDEKDHDAVFEKVFNISGLHEKNAGMVFAGRKLLKIRWVMRPSIASMWLAFK